MKRGPISSLSASCVPITGYGSPEALTLAQADTLLHRWGTWVRQERILGYPRINVLWLMSRKKGDTLSPESPEYDDQAMQRIDRVVAKLRPKQRKVVRYWYVFQWSQIRITGRFHISKRSVYRYLEKAKQGVQKS